MYNQRAYSTLVLIFGMSLALAMDNVIVQNQEILLVDGAQNELNRIVSAHEGLRYCLAHPATSWQFLAEEHELKEEPSNPFSKAHEGTITAIQFLSNDTKAFSSGIDGTIALWDITCCRFLKRTALHLERIECFTTTQSEEILFTGGKDGKACVWYVGEWINVRESISPALLYCYSHPEPVTCVAIASDKQYYATGSSDGKVRIFVDGKQTEEYTFYSPEEKNAYISIKSISFIDNDHKIMACSDGQVKTWQRTTGSVVIKGDSGTEIVGSMTITAQGEVLCGSSQGVLKLIDDNASQRSKHIMENTGVNALAISADTSFLVVGSVGPHMRADIWMSNNPVDIISGSNKLDIQHIKAWVGNHGIKSVAINRNKSAVLIGGHMVGTLMLLSFERLASVIGLKGAQLISLFPYLAQERIIDLHADTKRAAVYGELDEIIKKEIAKVYHVSR